MLTNLGVDKTAPQAIKIAETAFGKAITISRGKDGRLFVINVEGGGTKPPSLSGYFTRWNEAEDAVKRYVDEGNGRFVAKPDVEQKHPQSRLPSTTKRPKLPMRPGPEAQEPSSVSFSATESDQPVGNAVTE